MVMESPSPQCVGREFVRQYYTLMNEAPKYLHRFYSTNSSFIHSGVDRPGQEAEAVYGQPDIHKKIQELNFVDCHTKIRQVDSQATIGDGVVVQVTGELSNRGGPMRRFMQTFVLAHQTPKQYYVNNDIFRYQDEVFQDSYESEEEQESASSSRPVVENGVTETVQNGVSHQEEEISTPVAAVIPERAPTPPEPEPIVEPEAPPAEPAPVAVLPAADKPEVAIPERVEEEQPAKVEEVKVAEPEPVTPVAESKPVSEKPKVHSWANVAAGGSSSTVAVVPPMNSAPAPNKQATLPLATITAQQKEAEENIAAVAAVTAQEEAFTTQKSNNRGNADGGSRPPRHEFAGDRDRDRERDRRTNEKYPDSHQVFVGNLPVDIADLELKRFFNSYGKVMDVRVNRGPTGKVPFGFVVFDSPDPVTELLKLKRVEMNGHRLNVEEKKARSDRAGSNSRAPRNRPQQQRAGSRPKDRENSGSRSDNRTTHGGGRKYGNRQ